MQDANGFMWFGTKDGLNRFDGYQFKIFRHNPDDSTSIKNNFILSLAEDRNGKIWVATYKGLFHYNAKTEAFHLIVGTDNNEIRDIAIDVNNDVWFISGVLLCRYAAKTGQVSIFNEGRKINYTSVCADGKGKIYAASENGFLSAYDYRQKRLTDYAVFPQRTIPQNRWIEELTVVTDSIALIGTPNNGLAEYNLESRKLTDIISRNADGTGIFVRDIIRRNNHEFWVATESGLFVYDSETKKPST